MISRHELLVSLVGILIVCNKAKRKRARHMSSEPREVTGRLWQRSETCKKETFLSINAKEKFSSLPMVLIDNVIMFQMCNEQETK